MIEEPRPSKPATEWQCICGKWVPIGYSRHTHAVPKRPAFSDLHAMRLAQEAGLLGVVPDALDAIEITHVLRTKEMPTR